MLKTQEDVAKVFRRSTQEEVLEGSTLEEVVGVLGSRGEGCCPER